MVDVDSDEYLLGENIYFQNFDKDDVCDQYDAFYISSNLGTEYYKHCFSIFSHVKYWARKMVTPFNVEQYIIVFFHY